jgi:hypothetical protein
MKKIEDLNYYELLEISPQANAQEIHRAYERIRRIYDPNSVALYSLFTPDETSIIHQRVEDAYRTLMYEDNRRRYDATLRDGSSVPLHAESVVMQKFSAQPVRQPLPPLTEDFGHEPAPVLPLAPVQSASAEPVMPATETPAAPIGEFIGEFTGPAIRSLREQRGLSLKDVADRTKVSARYYEWIEAENFSKLPVRTYLRGFLILYGKALGCDADRMAGDYLKRFETAMKPVVKK